MGMKVSFNSFKYDSIDGFIKNNEECYVILPGMYKGGLTGEMSLKPCVLPLNYEFP